MEAKDGYTGGHTERVAVVAVALAERLGYTGGELDAIEIGALLHDIGKVGIPERVLNKPGPLDDAEWEMMKRHPVISETILAEVDLPETVRQIARWSHERLDGAGYPDGLVGDEIPLPARIVLVADAWDALTSDRSYRTARTTLEALHELRSNAGTQFCPRVVEALEELYLDMPGILGGRAVRVVESVA
jgi:putative nucleotidyltransferase with HDIG domain